MTDLIGNFTDETLVVTEGVTFVNGRGGRDTLVLRVFPPDFPDQSGPRSYVITDDTISDNTGLIDLSYVNIEEVQFAVDNPSLVTIDASAFISSDPDAFFLLSISALGGLSDITGSAFSDSFSVSGADNVIDGGAGFDRAGVLVDTPASEFVIAGSGNSFTVTADGVELLSATDVERAEVRRSGSASGFGNFVVDGSASSVSLDFTESSSSDQFIGSAFDDVFFISSSASGQTDTFTGGGGADAYLFGRSLNNMNFTTITDFRPGDIIDLDIANSGVDGRATTFIGTAGFSGTAGEYRYFTQNGQTFVQVDLNGSGSANATLTIANGEFDLENTDAEGFDEALQISGFIAGNDLDENLTGTAGVDRFFGNTGDDVINGRANVDTAFVSGNQSDYTVTQTSTGVFQVIGPDGTDTLRNIEFLQFDDEMLRLLPGQGVSVNFETADPTVYEDAMTAIRDFDGNDLGGDGAWLRIGSADVNGDGDIDQILVNDAIGRFATVGTAPDGLVYFEDYSWAGETRIAGIYIDPLVQSGDVVAGSDEDSQRRFQNDLQIENINRVLGADDYDGDGLQEVYFALTDGTAYIRAIMEFDGNIRYANYQSEQEVIDYLTSNGYDQSTYGDWFTNNENAEEAVLSQLTASQGKPDAFEPLPEIVGRPFDAQHQPVEPMPIEFYG